MSQELMTLSPTSLTVSGADDLARIALDVEKCRPELLNGSLVPADDCRRIVSALSSDLQALATPIYAAEIGRVFIGMFPRGQPTNPDVYVAGLAALLSTYPASILKPNLIAPPNGLAFNMDGKVTDTAPSLTSVKSWLDRIVDQRRSLLRKAEYILKERARREKQAEEDHIFQQSMTPEEIERRKAVVAKVRENLTGRKTGMVLEND